MPRSRFVELAAAHQILANQPQKKKTGVKPKLAKKTASEKTPMKSTRGIAVRKPKTAAAKPKANTATKRAAKP